MRYRRGFAVQKSGLLRTPSSMEAASACGCFPRVSSTNPNHAGSAVNVVVGLVPPAAL